MKNKIVIGLIILAIGYSVYTFINFNQKRSDFEESFKESLKENGHSATINKGDINVGLKIGDEAPILMADSIDEEKRLLLNSYRGRPVMINFWATWCPPCREEMPDIQKLHAEGKIEVVSVNMIETEKRSNVNLVKQFIEDYGITFDVWLDKHNLNAGLYQIKPIPTTYFLNADGIITSISTGFMTYEDMLKHIETTK